MSVADAMRWATDYTFANPGVFMQASTHIATSSHRDSFFNVRAEYIGSDPNCSM